MTEIGWAGALVAAIGPFIVVLTTLVSLKRRGRAEMDRHVRLLLLAGAILLVTASVVTFVAGNAGLGTTFVVGAGMLALSYALSTSKSNARP